MEIIKNYLNFENPKQMFIDICLWFLCGGFILWISRCLKLYIFCCDRNYLFLIKTPDSIKIAAFFLLLIGFFYFIKLFYKRSITIGLNTDKTFSDKNNDWPGSWKFNGGNTFDPEQLVIRSSRAGCILDNYYWKNFSMSFKVKFDENSCEKKKLFGIIFRARDLDNYFMLEIGNRPERENKPAIKPHVRYKGGWEELAIKMEDEFNFDEKDKLHKFKLMVIGDTVDLYYYKNGENKVFSWQLPTHVDVNHYESGVREETNEKKTDMFLYQGHVQEIYFRLDYGLIGFRSHWNHTPVTIKNLTVIPVRL